MREEESSALLAAALAYPRSIAALLFSPSRLIGPRSDREYTPPLLAFALSVVIYFVGDGIVSRVQLAEPGGIDFPSLGTMVATGLWISVVLTVARIALSRLFGLRTDPPSHTLVVLLWVVNVGFVAYGLIAIAAVWFPETTVSAATVFDSGYLNMPDDWTFPMIWTHAVSTASAPFVAVLTIWALFNAIRGAFETTLLRAALATVTTAAVVSVVTLLVGSATHGITRQLYLWTNPG